MEAAALEEIASYRFRSGRDLPLRFRRQPRTCPLRVGVGFVIADVANRLFGTHGAPSWNCVVPPLAFALLPIEWHVPTIRGELVPAIGKPQCSLRVAAVVHEFEVFAVRDAARCQLEGLQV